MNKKYIFNISKKHTPKVNINVKKNWYRQDVVYELNGNNNIGIESPYIIVALSYLAPSKKPLAISKKVASIGPEKTQKNISLYVKKTPNKIKINENNLNI